MKKLTKILLISIGVLSLFEVSGCQNNGSKESELAAESSVVIGTSMLGKAPNIKPVEVFNLYESVAPGSESWTHEETSVRDGAVRFNVVQPTLEVYLPSPEKATGSAMIVCPGGGFTILSYLSEGVLPAQELCERGIAAFVLKYRTTPVMKDGKITNDLGDVMGFVQQLLQGALDGSAIITQLCLDLEYSHLAFEDADRAISLVRQRASEWNIHPDKIGIMGFSAGAITSMHQVLEHSEGGKPDFAGIIYGGWTPDVQAPVDASPLFLCAPVNDVFTPDESIDVYKAWRNAKVPVELHYYQQSVHGFGAVPTGKSSDLWIEEMYRFMQDAGFVGKD